MSSYTHTSIEANLYPTEIKVINTLIKLDAHHAFGANLQSQGLIALLGRDMLMSFKFIYDGISG
jgi:hypothetical protein